MGRQIEKDSKVFAAIIGGSFNPVTNGHLHIARVILNEPLGIDRVFLMPAYRHPFEKHKEYTDYRIHMIRLVETRQIRYFGYEIENRLSGETYETIKRLLSDPVYGQAAETDYHFSMVIGADCVFDFDTRWKNAEKLAKLIPFIIFPRPGYSLKDYSGLLSKPPHRILKGVPTLDVSASEVRKRVQEEKSITGLVPQPVEEFIYEKNLFVHE